ncbi:tannase/feruloyl esterase family alpha/beta hydrolase [Croceibacterium aestuarii]|uniref:tannase/feruloyl esterase family alpha/beta hydrolase n=1 Tax=Croceibacterium aestuarii TaxID=3064139 RepID=UPI00272DE311|nr:tannase/feruloyl esterase family alpha/beta hydrolase [Croceibacterium sp. D39]
MRIHHRARCLAAAGLAVATATAAQAPSGAAAERCAALPGEADPALGVEHAAWVPAGPLASQRPGAPEIVLPAHCRVTGAMARRTGVGGREFAIGYELRLPAVWNGRFLFQGGGGMDGQVNPAVGTITGTGGPVALARGYAVVATDSGHTGSIVDATFGADQQARIDYGYNALDKVTAAAKALIRRNYGKAPHHSYFVGCSNGGRQALTAAQRLPTQFDGIVAGHPTLRFSRVALDEVWNLGVLARIAPRDAAGHPLLAKAFSDAELQEVKTRLLKRCDARDGLPDGLIYDWQGCDFDPAMAQCKPGETGACLSKAKADALRELMRGPRTSDGRIVYGPFNYDTGIAGPAWRGMRLGSAETGAPNAADATLGLGQLRWFQLTPPDPDYDPWQPMDLETMLARVAPTAMLADADNPFLSTFVGHGKLIAYNGLSDQGMASSELARWFESALAASGRQAKDAMRLYLVPGMTHCGGGEATDRFEMLDAIVDWVEKDVAPGRIVAQTSAAPKISRPLCPWPKYARYTGGDTASAASFECVE